jgi:hypothetical protein
VKRSTLYQTAEWPKRSIQTKSRFLLLEPAFCLVRPAGRTHLEVRLD